MLFFTNCGNIGNRLPWAKKGEKTVIATAFNKMLYLEDFEEILPKGISSDDSTRLAREFINQWIKRQIMLDKAQYNLTPEELDISKEIEDYRSSLLIYRYQEQMVKAKLDTVVTQQQIEDYYNEKSSEFLLTESLYKAIFLKVATTSEAEIKSIKAALSSDKEGDKNEIDRLSNLPGSKLTDYDDAWVSISILQKELPTGIYIQEKPFVNKNTVYDFADEDYAYFFYISNIVLKGQITPLEYIKTSIKNFILSRRKVEFLTQLDNDLYEDAFSKNLFSIINTPNNSRND